jgi:glutamate formiminotransferase / formiminotetrahydrofolate cyclodeaminase
VTSIPPIPVPPVPTPPIIPILASQTAKQPTSSAPIPMPVVECVPNFSEGRRPEVIDAIVEAIRRGGAVRLLDVSSDSDHNRTVVTFAGAPDAVESAAFAGIATAAKLINLDEHKGEHPRLGATDVVPFIPIRDVKMEDCIAIAKRLGERVANELGIPVYLYESAATRPERENLENIRRGEYEGLKSSIATDPDRAPDYGKVEIGSAGATVIGARAPLIAFNVYLNTADVSIAKKIAKVVRHSTGGLRYVKALGLQVDGKAQVSMNLTNFEKTPIHHAVEMIRREAQRYGVGIAYTELVGLTPENALIDSARWYLQLDVFQNDQLLERRLNSVPLPEPEKPPAPNGKEAATAPHSEAASVEPAPEPDLEIIDVTEEAPAPIKGGDFGFLEKVAAGTATPGGGAVAAFAGGLAAALAEMVARLTIGKKKYADVETMMIAAADIASNTRQKLIEAVDDDVHAYNAVMDAYKIDKSDPDRELAIQVTLRRAADVPLDVMRLSIDAMRVAKTVATQGNVNAASDAATAVYMAVAAVESAALNVRVNVKDLTNPEAATALLEQMTALLNEARTLSGEVISAVRERAGLNQ